MNEMMRTEQDAGDGLSKQRLRAWLRILRATRLIESELRDKLRVGHDSTLPRFDVLATLARYPDGLRMSEVSSHLKVSNGNVTGIVERLVSEGLSERVSVEGDRRAMRVRLTEAGKTRFAAMAAEHEAWVDAILADFDADELDTLISLLSRVKERAKP
ncbi:MarR family winged helix-turn-helix transcriptional regulator [Aestuariibius sp. 2305UL40-4]|uniref:MarR family winged helix-turn-helix transcriptional regulator n=1 Tax=Aestuariibius violaceus TaxID=3234132 RepID=UPI00345EFFD0